MYCPDCKARQGFLLRVQLIFRIPGVHTRTAELHPDTAAAAGDSSGFIAGTWAAPSFPRQLEPPCALQSACTLCSAEEKLPLHAGISCARQLLKISYLDSA